MMWFRFAAWCLTLVALPALAGTAVEQEGPLTPCAPTADSADAGAPSAAWGIVIATAFSKQEALDQFAAAKQTYADLLDGYQPILIEQCDLHMGTDVQYSARIGVDSREDADRLCAKLQAKGGACVVQKN